MNKMKLKKIFACISLLLVICIMFSGCMPAATAGADGETVSPTAGLLQMLPMLAVLVAVMYFFMIRPERKRKKAVEEMRIDAARRAYR